MLDFEAMFEEQVRSEALSKYSIAPHACVLRFFVEDDTIEVTELPLPNSGRVEKRLVRRHRVCKPDMGLTHGNDDHWSINNNATTTSCTPTQLRPLVSRMMWRKF